MALDEEQTYTRVGYSSNASSYSVSVGAYAANSDQGTMNTIVGHAAGYFNYGGESNTYIGYLSGHGEHSHGDNNVAVGRHSNFYGNGSNNTMIGCFSGSDSNAANSVYLGHKAGYYNDRNNTLMIDNTSTGASLIYGEFDNDLVRINGNLEITNMVTTENLKVNGKVNSPLFVNGFIEVSDTISSSLAVDDTSNNHNILAIDVNNTGDGNSDVGFSMENIETDFKWTFRTYNPSEGFAASKIGTGGTEFEVGNTGTTLATTVVKMGGVVVFKNGHLVNKSGNELTSLVNEQSIKLADAMAKMEAKDAEMIAMKAEAKAKGQKIAMMEAEISELKVIKQKVAMMESILTNLALNTSDTDKTKVSLNLK